MKKENQSSKDPFNHCFILIHNPRNPETLRDLKQPSMQSPSTENLTRRRDRAYLEGNIRWTLGPECGIPQTVAHLGGIH